MKLTKHYDRNVNLGNYQTARIGITLETDIENPNKKKIKDASNKLLDLCKELVDNELKTIKKEEA